MQTAIDMNQQAKFVVSASNSFALLKEAMAGRMSYLYVEPLSYFEYLKL